VAECPAAAAVVVVLQCQLLPWRVCLAWAAAAQQFCDVFGSCICAMLCAQHPAACCTWCLHPCSLQVMLLWWPSCAAVGLEVTASKPGVWHSQWFLVNRTVVAAGCHHPAGLSSVAVVYPCPACSSTWPSFWQWSWCPAVGVLGWVATVTSYGTTLCSVAVLSLATVCACML
jgi:hypothetical protein